MTELSKVLEAILFVAGEPLQIAALAQALETTELEISAAADELETICVFSRIRGCFCGCRSLETTIQKSLFRHLLQSIVDHLSAQRFASCRCGCRCGSRFRYVS